MPRELIPSVVWIIIFLNYANGIAFREIKTYDDEDLSQSYKYLGENNGFASQQAFLGYQSYVIDPVTFDDNNTQYISSSNPNNLPVDHNFFVSNSGKRVNIPFHLLRNMVKVYIWVLI